MNRDKKYIDKHYDEQFKSNPVIKKYKDKLDDKQDSKGFKKAKSQALKKYKVGTKDEYPKKFRNAFVEAVGIYNKNHPE